MSQSLSQLYIHITFHTKHNQDLIKPDVEKELYAFFGGILKSNKSIPIAINGIDNHVHIFCIMSKSIALCDLLEELKRNSSRWIKTKGDHYKDFAWHGGYGAFSVSPSKVDIVKKYIQKQKLHHKGESYQEEYIRLLKEHGISYNQEHIWN